jgi:acetolactate synthase-1/2/3 large subunit
MTGDSHPTTVAQALVEGLITNGIGRVFCVPGESYLSVLDALWARRDAIETVTCRHEAGAANMAEAYGKLTGKPGICFVTRGPGATHASVGVHTAKQDSTPMILFVGQVALADREREAFQEVDYRAAFGPLAKWATELERPERVAELIERAFGVAMQGRQGPVVIALPEDVLDLPSSGPTVASVRPARCALSQDTIDDLAMLLGSAEKPMVLLGGSGWDAEAVAAIEQFAAATGVPVALSFRRKDLLDNFHPCYAGDLGLGPNPQLVARFKKADLVIALGARLGENPSQAYSLFSREEAGEKLVHIHAGAEELGRVWPTRLRAVADVGSAAQALAGLTGVNGSRWAEWTAQAHAQAVQFRAPIANDAKVNLSEVFCHLSQALPKDAIVCNGAGNYAAWLHRFYPHQGFRTQLAPTSGAMGYGFPAAIAAKLTHPEREVVAVAGDGCFLMTGQELATAAQHGANLVVVVVDNASYGTIRMHQERHFPGRVMATDLTNPDFAAFARAFGCFAVTVEETAAFPAALAAARNAGKPALIHLKTDVEHIAPGRTVTGMRTGG